MVWKKIEELTSVPRPEEQLAANSDLSDAARIEEETIHSVVAEYQPPPGYDDSNDPSIPEHQLPPALQKQPGASLLPVIRLRPDAPEEAALRIAEKVAGSAGLGELFGMDLPQQEQAQAEPGEAEASTAALSSLEPRLRLRVLAMVCRNSDGKASNGDVGQSRAELETAISTVIAGANTILANANVELVFSPSADIEFRNDTFLNQDFIIPASEQWKLTKHPPLTKDKAKALANSHSTAAYRNSICSQYKGRIVLLFAEGTGLVPGVCSG